MLSGLGLNVFGLGNSANPSPNSLLGLGNNANPSPNSLFGLKNSVYPSPNSLFGLGLTLFWVGKNFFRVVNSSKPG